MRAESRYGEPCTVTPFALVEYRVAAFDPVLHQSRIDSGPAQARSYKFLFVDDREKMEAKITNSMQVAMSALVDEIFHKKHEDLTIEDIDWIRRLCIELRDRINLLTPRRSDLHAELCDAFDVDLLIQMLKFGATDAKDTQHCVRCIFARLGMLCAPSEDAHVATMLQNAESGKCNLGQMLIEANKIVDKIEAMSKTPEAIAFSKHYAERKERS